jgi:hypothetical protein
MFEKIPKNKVRYIQFKIAWWYCFSPQTCTKFAQKSDQFEAFTLPVYFPVMQIRSIAAIKPVKNIVSFQIFVNENMKFCPKKPSQITNTNTQQLLGTVVGVKTFNSDSQHSHPVTAKAVTTVTTQPLLSSHRSHHNHHSRH